MERSEHLTAFARDGQAFAESAATARLDAPVASCPGWTVADLVWHVSRVFYFWGSIVTRKLTSPDGVGRIDRVADDQLVANYRLHFKQLLDSLQSTDPKTTVWSWSDEKNVAFVVRRMAQETAVHRWDMDQATGRATPIEPTLASDGVDEFLTHFLEVSKTEPVGGSVHLHCGDVAGEWTVRQVGDAYEIERAHAKGDCALRGTASDLLLALWRRIGIDQIDVVGDRGVAERFLASSSLD